MRPVGTVQHGLAFGLPVQHVQSGCERDGTIPDIEVELNAGPGRDPGQSRQRRRLLATLQTCDDRLLHPHRPRQLRLGQATIRPVTDNADGYLTSEDGPVPLFPELRVFALAVHDLLQGRQLAELHRPSTSSSRSSAATTARLNPRGSASASGPTAASTNTSPNRR